MNRGSRSVPAVAVAATYSPTRTRQESADQAIVHGIIKATPMIAKLVSMLTGLVWPPVAKASAWISAPVALGGSTPTARG